MVNGNQQTVCWHVDDCKLSHRDKRVNNRFNLGLKEEYKSIFEDGSGQMTVCRGKVHNYLGMKLYYTQKGLCYITMFEQIKEIIQIFEELDPNSKGTKASAEPSNLFIVRYQCPKLSEKLSVGFHRVVAKTLFTTKRARPDSSTSLSFLTTMVKKSYEDDWSKLGNLGKYFRGTK